MNKILVCLRLLGAICTPYPIRTAMWFGAKVAYGVRLQEGDQQFSAWLIEHARGSHAFITEHAITADQLRRMISHTPLLQDIPVLIGNCDGTR